MEVTQDDSANGPSGTTRLESLNALEQILTYHPKRQILDQRGLRRLVQPLKPGSYLLMRSEAKPPKQKYEIKVRSVFSLAKWKTGRLRVVPLRSYPEFVSHYPYVSFFKFTVPAQ
jgi:hypothetical protein